MFFIWLISFYISTISSGHGIATKWISSCQTLDVCYTQSNDLLLTNVVYPWLSTPSKGYGNSAFTLFISGSVAVSQSWVDQNYLNPNHQRPALN